jgi:hypothetical protein
MYDHDSFASNYHSDFLYEVGFQQQNIPLQDADVVYIPFRLYKALLVLHDYEDTRKCLELVHNHALRLLAMKNITKQLVYSMSHNYGGAVSFNMDMRNYVNASLRQSETLADAIVLSPMVRFTLNIYLMTPYKYCTLTDYYCYYRVISVL